MADTASALILNVDDNEGARYANSRALKLGGYEVIEAGTAADALQLIRERKPDLVLLDVKLPDMSGLDVCKLIKVDPQTSSTLVLQTSASLLTTSDKIRALDGGADNFLILPIEPDELLANVRALLRLRDVENAYRNAQTALAAGEERFRQIAENATDVFWIYGFAEKRFLYVNAACAAVWRANVAEITTDPEAWFRAIHPEDCGGARAALAALAHGGESDLQYRIGVQDGPIRWIRDRGFAIRDEQGDIYRAAGIARDVTEAQELADSLQASDRRKDEFLATLAHELRNPLAPIRTSVTLLQSALPDAPETVARAVAIIDRQSRHLTRLVDDLLDLARITQGKITLRTGALELQTTVASAVESVTAFAQGRNQRIDVDMPAAPIVIQGDAVRISQVIGNLLHNACKFSAHGKAIALAVTLKGPGVEIAVRDEGIGIRAGALADVFGLFVQDEHLPDAAQEGLGIGLSLVKRLAEMHGGSVRAESAGENRGATFVVTLPVAQAAGAPAPAAPSPAPAAGKRRVLVVDDNADAADSMVAILDLCGHEGYAAYTPEAALMLARDTRPDVAVLDIGLPGMSGYELVGLMREALGSGTTMIALTGYGQESDMERARDAGFDHHLTKPVDTNALIQLIGQAPQQSA